MVSVVTGTLSGVLVDAALLAVAERLEVVVQLEKVSIPPAPIKSNTNDL